MKNMLLNLNWYKISKTTFNVGDKVKLRDDVLRRHGKSVPASAGFTTEQFAWRKTLEDLLGKVGVITKVFSGGNRVNHVNVDFDGHLIGIATTELEMITIMPHDQKFYEKTFGKDE